MNEDTRNRLGFAVKVVGKPGLRSHDTRRWQSKPHLRVSLGYLDLILDYLAETDIRMYRMASDLAPYVTKADLPGQHQQIEEAADDLERVGRRANDMGLRLSIHPSQYIVLNTPDDRVLDTALRTFASQAAIMDGMGLKPEHKIITHVGGLYNNRPTALARFAERYHQLPESVQARLIVENDDRLFPVEDVLWLHERTGIPIVFDWLHHVALNPAGIDPTEAARRCLATWPEHQRPKLHFSTVVGGITPGKSAPHADFIEPGDVIPFLNGLDDREFDVMLEAKQKDLALLRLRSDLAQAGLDGRFW
ncbi:MAG: UV DNA damage repair endonuclease UvsE [Chloroflexota bacterium]|nr:UV DNA damage repair endonuclease UvsE [Chloroflexota bacterium]